MTVSRRNVITSLGAGALAITTVAASAAERLRPTPQETFGPYFPVGRPTTHDFDLTQAEGKPGRARGQVMELSGRVLRLDGSPVTGAEIEIWQANAAGRYRHPMDKHTAPLDPNFEGVALLRSNDEGSYLIRTVKPGPYPDGAGGLRTPHIHFDVTAPDYRLVAQMYFPGEALNEKDMLINTMRGRNRDPALTLCKQVTEREPGVLRFEWDLVLLQA
jgi:protocatechuate 3,4-dioxygenase beta subunit